MARSTYSIAENFKFSKTDKNGQILIIDGFEFRSDKNLEKVHYFKCKEGKCKTRVKHSKLDGSVLINNVEHNHLPDGVSIAKRTFRIAFKEEIAEHPTTPTPQIFKSVRREIASEGIEFVTQEELNESIPIYANLKSSGYRKRQKTIPKLPTALYEIVLNGEYTITNDGRQFLLANDGEENKILIFGTVQFMEILCGAETVFMDGTFKSAPAIFTQIFSLHCFSNGIMIPALYCLLPNKQCETYSRMFRLIQSIAQTNSMQFNPLKFQIDYEMGIISAIRSIFGLTVEIKGCLFHYSQSIYRRVIANGLKTRYNDRKSLFHKFVKRLMGVALVPMNKIDSCMLTIRLEAPNDADTESLLEYFENNYCETTSLFPRSMWNHYTTASVRTINHIEGWHNCLNRSVESLHPNIFKLICELKKQQNDFELDLIAASNGNIAIQKKKYRKMEEKLNMLKLKLNSDEITTMKYLDEVKYLTKN